jgi:hypothetical protein
MTHAEWENNEKTIDDANERSVLFGPLLIKLVLRLSALLRTKLDFKVIPQRIQTVLVDLNYSHAWGCATVWSCNCQGHC